MALCNLSIKLFLVACSFLLMVNGCIKPDVIVPPGPPGGASDFGVAIDLTFEDLVGQLLETDPREAEAAYARFTERANEPA